MFRTLLPYRGNIVTPDASRVLLFEMSAQLKSQQNWVSPVNITLAPELMLTVTTVLVWIT